MLSNSYIYMLKHWISILVLSDDTYDFPVALTIAPSTPKKLESSVVENYSIIPRLSRSKSLLKMLSWRQSGRRSGKCLPQRWEMVNLSSLRILRVRSRRSWRRARTCSGTCIRRIGSLVLAATPSANLQARIASFMALPTWTTQVAPLVIMWATLPQRRTTLDGVRVCRSKLL